MANIVLDFFDDTLHGQSLSALSAQVHESAGQTVTAEAAGKTPS